MRTLALLLAALLLLAAPAEAEHLYESDRLRISGDVPEEWIDQAAALGKELYAALEVHFGQVPAAKQLPLELVLYPRRSAFEKALRLQGSKSDGAHVGGWTVWKTGVSHVWLQKEPFDTRRLILHELFHQFHDKCRDYSRRADGASWYREGLAEWFGWHRRTAKGLRFGALDAVAMNSLARRAAQRVRAKDFDPWAVAMGRTKANYVDALALVGGLLLAKDKDLRARFRFWEREVLAKGGDAAAFRKRFAERREDLLGALRLGWSALGGQWKPSGLGWDEENGTIRVKTGIGTTTVMRVGAPAPPAFSYRFEIVTGTEPKAAGGVVLSLRPGGDLRVMVDRGEVWATTRRSSAAAGAVRHEKASLPPGHKTVLDVLVTDTGLVVHASRAGKRASLNVTTSGARVTSWGFVAENTGARFRLLPPDATK